jgi:hypothetical protein
MVGRHQIGIVERRLRVEAVAARRLDAYGNIAKEPGAHTERAIDDKRIGFRLTPTVRQCLARGCRHRGEIIAVVRKRKRLAEVRVLQDRHQRAGIVGTGSRRVSG